MTKFLSALLLSIIASTLAYADYTCDVVISKKDPASNEYKKMTQRELLVSGHQISGGAQIPDLIVEKDIETKKSFSKTVIHLAGRVNSWPNEQIGNFQFVRNEFVYKKKNEWTTLASLDLKGDASSSVEFENYKADISCSTAEIPCEKLGYCFE